MVDVRKKKIKIKIKIKPGLQNNLLLIQYALQKTIELKSIQRGNYFRILADAYVDGENLADGLIKSGDARSYEGGKRLGWCE